MRCYFILLTLLFFSGNVKSQLHKSEATIKEYFEQLIQSGSDSSKIEICKKIENAFAEILTDEASFSYPFSNLDKMGKMTSPDRKFRLYNWNCVMADGTYRYFGAIQYRQKSQIIVKQLNDRANPDMFTTNTTENWPGALYYKIIPFKAKRNSSYLLLGWDGNNVSTNKKLIEVLRLGKRGISFGAPVISWRGKMLNRVVFEYAKQASMTIQYQEKRKKLIFDHLAPSSPGYQNQFEYYGPDFSYDVLVYEKGIWVLQENVDVRGE